MNKYLQDYQDFLYDEDKSERTIRAYLTDLRLFFDWFAHDHASEATADEITPLDIIDYRSVLLEAHKKPATINRTLISISNFLQWAEQENIISSNPAIGVHTVTEQTLGPQSLERKEQLAFIRAVRKTGKLRDLTIITLLLHTGIRVGELCNLTHSDITLSPLSNMLTVRKGKGTKQRSVPLNPTITRVLKEYLNSQNCTPPVTSPASHAMTPQFLFYGQKRMPLSDRGVRHLIKKYAYIAKLPHVTPHIFRHTCAKNLIDAGNPIDRVARILGHSSIATTSLYTIPTDRDLHVTMNSISWE